MALRRAKRNAYQQQQHDLHISRTVYGRHGSAATNGKEGADSSVALPGYDELLEGHRFIRNDVEAAGVSQRASAHAKRDRSQEYYARLFKEYAVVDLSLFKTFQVGMRWRTKKEVDTGKGKFVCAEKRCHITSGLSSYEVNFAYKEKADDAHGKATAGKNGFVRKNALVKVRVCGNCAYKLFYKKIVSETKHIVDNQKSKKRSVERSSIDSMNGNTNKRAKVKTSAPHDDAVRASEEKSKDVRSRAENMSSTSLSDEDSKQDTKERGKHATPPMIDNLHDYVKDICAQYDSASTLLHGKNTESSSEENDKK